MQTLQSLAYLKSVQTEEDGLHLTQKGSYAAVCP